MNKKSLYLIKKEISNNIDKIYHGIWDDVLTQFKENNNESGSHFWLERNNDNHYTTYFLGINGFTKKEFETDEIEYIKNMLLNNGFEIIETKSNRSLIMIDKEKIINYINNENSLMETHKMPITPFTETRRRK